ncbi:MAG TPA: transglycosylase family protein [Acidimicrobiales bacterium]|nr:transglycosylase family protein [Acidimicrobiales bacterium]
MTASGAGRLVRPIAVAAAFAALSPLVAGPAGRATTVTSLSARADAIAASVEADQGRLAVVGERYVVESAALTAARGREATARAGVAADSAHIAADRASLRASAITAYVEAGSASTLALYLSAGTEVASTGSAYLNAASGELQGRIASLDGDEHRLDVLDATARAEAANISAALSQLGSDRQSALTELGAERQALSSARGQLAALVAARAAVAARREEARAAAAAQAAAAANAAAATNAAAAAASAGPPSLAAVTAAAPSTPAPGSVASAFAGIRNCESSGDYGLNTGNGYYGAYQFSASTWAGLGGSGLPSSAAPSAQDAAAYRLYQQDGFAAWPECAAILGL